MKLNYVEWLFYLYIIVIALAHEIIKFIHRLFIIRHNMLYIVLINGVIIGQFQPKSGAQEIKIIKSINIMNSTKKSVIWKSSDLYPDFW